MKAKKRLEIGDVVKYIGDPEHWKTGEQHIITGMTWMGGHFEYATDQGAWFTRKDFEYVRRATRKELIKAMEAV